MPYCDMLVLAIELLNVPKYASSIAVERGRSHCHPTL